jgi:TolB-like protein
MTCCQVMRGRHRNNATRKCASLHPHLLSSTRASIGKMVKERISEKVVLELFRALDSVFQSYSGIMENETMSDTSFSENPPRSFPDHPEVSLAPSVKRRRFPFLLVGSHLMVFVFGFIVAYGLTGWTTGRQARSIAIMPFSGDWRPPGLKEDWVEKNRYFIETSLPASIAKEIVAKASPGTVKVIATHEVRDRKLPEKSPSPQQFGQNLNVSAVLSGKVGPDGGLTLQLIAVNSGELLWSNTYAMGVDGASLAQVFRDGVPINLHAEITQKVIQNLTGREF